jgi:23S rRNA (adenine2503-C2)-methyltransferase
MKKPFASLALADLKTELAALGQKPYVAKQVCEAVYKRNVGSFDEITNVSLELRRQLFERYDLRTLTVSEEFDSPDGSFKLLLRLADGNLIECAYLAGEAEQAVDEDEAIDAGSPGKSRRGTVCVSSQVGCAMGCLFCASGEKGLVRNLAPFEMVEQILAVRDHLAEGFRLTNVTFMGIGEPLANFKNLVAALELINSADGLNIGARRISISTCGFPEMIRKLADLGKQYHLAISLHAPTDDLRKRLMPAASKSSLKEILRAAKYYCEKTTRKITFEYVLIKDQNDSIECARELAKLLGQFPSMVNLIPMNPVSSFPDLERPSKTRVAEFLTALAAAKVEACVRRRKGAEVDAACGQLRARVSEQKPAK